MLQVLLNPLLLISQSLFRNIRYRAAARPQNIANEEPLTKPATTFSGRPNSFLSHDSATSPSFEMKTYHGNLAPA